MGSADNSQDRRLSNKRHVDLIIYDLNGLFDLTEDRQWAEYGMEILNDILTLDPEFRNDNDEVLQPLHLYFTVLAKRVRLAIDYTVRNEEVEQYTEFFCVHKEEILRIFNSFRLQKVLMFLLVDNYSLHDLDGASRIMDEYSNVITYSYRPILYLRLIRMTCAKLSLQKHVYSLYDRFDINIKYYKDTPGEPMLLANLFVLAKELGLEERAEPVRRYILDILPGYNGVINAGILNLMTELARYRFHIEEIKKWIESVSADDAGAETKQKFSELKDLCGEPGRKRAEREVFAPMNSFDDLFRKIAFRMKQRDYSRAALYGEVKFALEYYKQHSHEAEPFQGNRRFQCNSYYYDLLSFERSLRFWSDFEKALTPYNNMQGSDKVFFFVNEWSLVNASLSLPILMAAEKHGYTYVPTSPRMSVHEYYGDPFLEEAAGVIGGDIDIRYTSVPYVSGDYEIDIPGKRIIVQGMNVYQPVYEFVARYQFSYFINYDTDAWARYHVLSLVRTFDRLFTYIREIDEWAEKNGKQVYFVSHAPHLHNAAAFRIYCEENDTNNHLQYICVSSGYDNYFKNIGDAKTETISALNLTANPFSRNSFLGTKEGFDRFFEANESRIEDIRKKAIPYLTMSRALPGAKTNADEKNRILELIKKCKSENRKVCLLIGKVIFDLAVKNTQGCVHGDMSEWITHAVKYAGQNKDILLLIKPHPHESRTDLTLTSNRVHTLRSVIKSDLSENVIYLDNNMFTNAELTPYVDLALIWNGTSSLELAAQKVPVLMGDIWGHYDYPIGFVRPQSLEEYESYMKDPSLMKEPDDLDDKALMFLDYMGSNDVRIENRYSKTTTLNFNQFDSKIDLQAVYRYFEKGDKELDSLFESLLR